MASYGTVLSLDDEPPQPRLSRTLVALVVMGAVGLGMFLTGARMATQHAQSADDAVATLSDPSDPCFYGGDVHGRGYTWMPPNSWMHRFYPEGEADWVKGGGVPQAMPYRSKSRDGGRTECCAAVFEETRETGQEGNCRYCTCADAAEAVGGLSSPGCKEGHVFACAAPGLEHLMRQPAMLRAPPVKPAPPAIKPDPRTDADDAAEVAEVAEVAEGEAAPPTDKEQPKEEAEEAAGEASALDDDAMTDPSFLDSHAVLAAPAVKPLAGMLDLGQPIVLTAPGADTICYSVDGRTTPVCSPAHRGGYAGGVLCEAGTPLPSGGAFKFALWMSTLQAIACKGGIASPAAPPQTYTSLPAPVPVPIGGSTDVGVTPPVVNVGQHITLMADEATSVCFSMDGRTRPFCREDGGCAAGKQIHPGGHTAAVTALLTTLHAVACKVGGIASTPMQAQLYMTLPPPKASPQGGWMSTGTSVTLSTSGTESAYFDASICYTTGGSVDPACDMNGSCRQGTALADGGHIAPLTAFITTLKAVACLPHGVSSAPMEEQTYNTPFVLAQPSGGLISTGARVTLEDVGGAAQLCYSLDGDIPRCNADGTCAAGVSLEGGGQTPGLFASVSTLKAVACRPNGVASGTVSFLYITLSPPEATPAPGLVSGGTAITLEASMADTVCYTIDGSQPLCSTAAGMCSAGLALAPGGQTVGLPQGNTKLRAVSCKGGAMSAQMTDHVYMTLPPPVAIPASGLLSADAPVVLSAPDATHVCYSTDGVTVPSCEMDGLGGCHSGTVLGHGHTVPPMGGVGMTTTTLKAIACHLGDIVSAPMADQTYVTLSQPQSSEPAGLLTHGEEVVLTATDATKICYSVDDTVVPACKPVMDGTGLCDVGDDMDSGGSFVFTAADATLRAVACKAAAVVDGVPIGVPIHSNVFEARYMTLPSPAVEPADGAALFPYESLTLTAPGAVAICYTLDGSEPQCGPFHGCGAGDAVQSGNQTHAVGSAGNFTVNAIACSGAASSAMAVHSYTEATPTTTQAAATTTTAAAPTAAAGETAAPVAEAAGAATTLPAASTAQPEQTTPQPGTAAGPTEAVQSGDVAEPHSLSPPVATPEAGLVSTGAIVTLTTEGGAQLCFSMGEVLPVCSADGNCEEGTGAMSGYGLSFTASVATINAVACLAGTRTSPPLSSLPMRQTYRTLPAPTASPPGGTVSVSQRITLTAEGAAAICYSMGPADSGEPPSCDPLGGCQVGQPVESGGETREVAESDSSFELRAIACQADAVSSETMVPQSYARAVAPLVGGEELEAEQRRINAAAEAYAATRVVRASNPPNARPVTVADAAPTDEEPAGHAA